MGSGHPQVSEDLGPRSGITTGTNGPIAGALGPLPTKRARPQGGSGADEEIQRRRRGASRPLGASPAIVGVGLANLPRDGKRLRRSSRGRGLQALRPFVVILVLALSFTGQVTVHEGRQSALVTRPVHSGR